MKKTEKEKLEQVAGWFTTKKGLDSNLIKYGFLTLKSYFRGSSVLELGCADGQMTEILVNYFDRVVSVDASKKFVKEIEDKIRTPNLEAIHSLFEDFNPKEKFNTIIMGHILEHILEPIKLLKRSKKWLSSEGVILIEVPNANSLHRQAGVEMGLLEKCDELGELDKKLFHRRVYTRIKLEKDIKKAGLKIVKMGGIFLKPLTNKQIEETWTEQMMDAFYELGKRYPEIAANIYAVCTV